jgi:hypothetical protein
MFETKRRFRLLSNFYTINNTINIITKILIKSSNTKRVEGWKQNPTFFNIGHYI